MKKLLLQSIFGAIFVPELIKAENWAQTGGRREQNVLNPAEVDWFERVGHAVAVAHLTVETNKLFLVGGEAYENMLVPDSPSEGLLHYKNDVWVLGDSGYNTYADNLQQTTYHDPRPIIQGRMSWTRASPGKTPPSGVTYEQWIECSMEKWSGVVKNPNCSDSTVKPGLWYPDNMWSARRNHQAIYFNGALYVLGGRARELSDLPLGLSVGGIMSPRIAPDPFNSNWRERSVLRNDVWKSLDQGNSWILVTPGCHVNQQVLIKLGNSREGYAGSQNRQCNTDADCYGVESCEDLEDTGKKTCVCLMWSPREEHQVVIFNNELYLIGGMAALQTTNCGPFGCGATDASGHRVYMADVWKSVDGSIWTQVTGSANFGGRAGHQVITFNGALVLLGGAYRATWQLMDEETYYSDMWFSSDGINWDQNGTAPTWQGRARHLAVRQDPVASNSFIQRMYVFGGQNTLGYFSDCWSWTGVAGDPWLQDYFIPNTDAQYFVTAVSNLTSLQKVILPTDTVRLSVVRKPIISDDQLAMLHSMGIVTILDLASASPYQILQLRGFDYPEVTDRLGYGDVVCDHRALAQAVVSKCSVQPDLYPYDGEDKMPWNTKVVYDGPLPVVANAAWEGIDYRATPTPTTMDQVIANWDGCTIIPGFSEINFAGIGNVPQVKKIRDPWRELNELHCQWNPFPRTQAAGAFFHEKVMLLGGTNDIDQYNMDAWYREDVPPITTIKIKPKSGTSQHTFEFYADKEGCIFEYRVYFLDENYEVRPWTLAYRTADIAFLDNKKGGPGEGTYIFYVRAIDPAGNRDASYRPGGRSPNFVIWHYVPPLPWALIIIMIILFLVLSLILYIWYLRRRRRKMLERYAIKRIRRKFKGLGADAEKATNWKALYADQKGDKKKKKKKGKKGVDPDERKDKKKGKKYKDYEKALKGGKGKKKKYKDYEKGEKDKEGGKKKYKDYEKGAKDEKKKKYKDYEKKEAGDGKKAKKYKDYETKGETPGEEKGKRFKDYEKKGKKLKDYEKEDLEEKREIEKQEKKKKRFKEYEQEAKDRKDEFKKPPREENLKQNELAYMLDGEEKEDSDGNDKPRRRRTKK